jgi:hypothetical protein
MQQPFGAGGEGRMVTKRMTKGMILPPQKAQEMLAKSLTQESAEFKGVVEERSLPT